MKLLIDENLPPRLAALLSEAGHDAAHVRHLDRSRIVRSADHLPCARRRANHRLRRHRLRSTAGLDRRHRTVGHPRARGRRPPPTGARRTPDRLHRATRGSTRRRSDGRRDPHRRSGSSTPAAVAPTADPLARLDGGHVGGAGHRPRQRDVHPRRRHPFRTRIHSVVSRGSSRMIRQHGSTQPPVHRRTCPSMPAGEP